MEFLNTFIHEVLHGIFYQSGDRNLKEDENLFNNAFEQLKKAVKIRPNRTYNLACYYSIINERCLR